jgi:hypothetical protein
MVLEGLKGDDKVAIRLWIVLGTKIIFYRATNCRAVAWRALVQVWTRQVGRLVTSITSLSLYYDLSLLTMQEQELYFESYIDPTLFRGS